ncbi:MAG: DUF4145 domain-containing protein [Planctomycetes bacterium]|nr:DUF4145 domain-containing protein [Planctomycetota bacterium]
MEKLKRIECPNCQTFVSANILCKKEFFEDETGASYCIYFLECPICSETMIGSSAYIQIDYNEWEFDDPTRLWPNQEKSLDLSIPQNVKASIIEANKCFNAKAHSACAVMCGRALEVICKENKTKSWTLGKGLKELKDNGVIDERLYDWGNALRVLRNDGAHATDVEISKEDARDVLDFILAICEFIYVLTDKYEKFREREIKRKIS